MNRPPFMIQPGSSPVSASRCIRTSRVSFNNTVSTSFGRNLQTQPAVCHVVPDVSIPRSRSTALTPRLVSWYKVWQPWLPPPETGTNLIFRGTKHFNKTSKAHTISAQFPFSLLNSIRTQSHAQLASHSVATCMEKQQLDNEAEQSSANGKNERSHTIPPCPPTSS